MTAKVNKHATGTKYGYTPTAEECWGMLHRLDFEIEHHLFLSTSYFTRLPETTLETFPKLEQGIHVFDFLRKLNKYVHEYLTFDPNITDVYTKVTDILEHRKGVCQDYAHLFISIARHNKIPSHYVSGYLNQQMGYYGCTENACLVRMFCSWCRLVRFRTD